MKLKVALMSGGNSSEREIALRSAAMVGQAFDRSKYDVYTVDVHGRDWTCTDPQGRVWPFDLNDFSVTADGIKIMLDYAFVMIHGTPGEDGKLQGYLEMMRIPYSSCGQVSTVVTFDKNLCKRTVDGIPGLNLARGKFLRKGEAVDAVKIISEFGLPLFIKPNASGSSYGVTKVKSEAEIPAAIEAAFAESDAILIEEFVAGREFGCGVLVTGEKEYLLPVTEIISKNDFFDLEAKYTEGRSDEITPADIPAELSAEIQRLALSAYKACGCRGIARVDFIVTPDGDIYMIEINSVPGMSPGSIVPKQVAAAGMTMTELIDIIIEDTRCSR